MRFGRKKDDQAGPVDEFDDAAEGDDATEQALPAGPRDVSEVDPVEGEYLDLGSLLLRPHVESELRLQVDEASGEVLAAMLVGEDGMLEVRAFAAARGEDLWSDARKEIAADAAQRGGTATEQDGPFGPELYCQLPVQLDDGTAGLQPSRVIGWNGPRWFVRAVLMGRPAMEPAQAADWEDTIRRMVVRRGTEPLPPGQALALRLPPDAQQVD
ncbi:DUF3710 domain-containing protein [Nocardioides terrisoli]|uniref:DUF3710 domain-containing protein n=1 Tax=Nocardioides terrisoli TaxID=3388267 RepID=UPI00287B618A|nr:DUF3710 domain-containing protein [Nocardioides marmorisolisilvae]